MFIRGIRPNRIQRKRPLVPEVRKFICSNCRTDWEVYADYEQHHAVPANICPECGQVAKMVWPPPAY